MSARAAVFTLLTTDSILAQYGIDNEHVWPAQSVDNPDRKGCFLVMRWEETSTAFGNFGLAEVLTIWAHQPKEIGTSYVPLLNILERVRELLAGAEHLAGEDGYLVQCDFQGYSPDFRDEGFSTLSKNAAFRVVSR